MEIDVISSTKHKMKVLCRQIGETIIYAFNHLLFFFFFSGHDNSTEGRVDEAVKVVCRDSRMKGNGRCDSSWHASLDTTIAIPRVGASGQVRIVMSDVLNDT